MTEIDKTLPQLDLLPINVPIDDNDIFYAVINGSDYAVPFARLTSQIVDADLLAIASIQETSGILRKTAANTWSLTTVKDELTDWFELAGTAPNQYLRCKHPFAGDYGIVAYGNSGQLPPSIWLDMPIATATILGGVKIGANINVTAEGVISVASGAAMTYPAAGIALSTGTAWGASIPNNSANWNTAFNWGNHAGLYAPISTVSSQWVTSGNNIYYNGGNAGVGTTTPTLGKLQVNGLIAAYRYGAGTTNLPAITMDKPSSYAYGIGPDGTAMRIRYGAVNGMEGASWIDAGGIEHYFDGHIKLPNGLLQLNKANTGSNAYHELNRNAISTENMFVWKTADSARWYLGQRSNNEDRFSLFNAALGTDNITIIPNGNIGIRKSDPQKNLEIYASSPAIRLTESVNDYYWDFLNTMDDGDLIINRGSSLVLHATASRIGLFRQPAAYALEVAGDIYATGGWFRTTGDAGWYSETYGGGIYMIDSTYVRIYNNKKLFVNSDIIAAGRIIAYGNA